jgi:recombination protein RecA
MKTLSYAEEQLEYIVEQDKTKKASIEAAIKQINSAYGLGAVWSALDEIPKIAVVSTGALTLDKALGVGGLPKGRITELFGPEQTAKTTLALTVIANIQKEGGTGAIIDVEHAIDIAYAKAIGVDVTKLLISQPDSAEQALEIAEALVRGGVDCVVLDSVAMLVTEAEIKGDMTDMQYAPTARLMGKALRKLMAPIDKANCVFILINQLRDKIGGYGNPEVTPGGRSIKYMSSVRIDLRRKEQIKDDDQVYGIRVLAKVIKNKVAPPSKQAEFSVYYGKGIDRIESVVDAAFDEGVITRSGAWYKLDGEQLGQGKPNTIARLKDDQVLLKRIEDALWVKAQK